MSEAVPAVAVEPQPIPARAAPAAPAGRSYVGHAKVIGALTLVSRFAGLGREIVAGHYLGTGLVASAFTVAFTIPNLFRKLFGEGALSAAFIPLYAQAVKADSDARPAENTDSALSTQHSALFAAASFNVLCVMLVALTLVGEAVLFGMMYLGRDMRPDRLLTLRLTAIMLPYVLLICGTALLGGVLQVHRRFAAPAAAPVLLNVCHVAVVVVGAWILGLDPKDTDAARVTARQTTLSYWLAFFVLVAGALQLVVLMPSLRAVGFRFRPFAGVWTPMVRRMLLLTLPVAVGAGVLQLSVLLDKALSTALMRGVDAAGNVITHFTLFGHAIAYPLEAGAPARLNLAQFLYQFPLGVFAIALATAIFPALSSDALDRDREKFKSVLRGGIEASLWEGIPASLGLILVAGPAVNLLFRHGQIGAHDADLIARSVVFYAAGIWAFSMLQIVNRAYYAIHDTVTPLVMSVVNIVLNLVVEIPMLWVPWLAESGMAVGTLVSFTIQAVVMLWMLDRRIGGLGLSKSVIPVLKMVGATAAMGVACWGVMRLPFYPRGETRVAWAVQLILVMGTGAVVYVGACAALGLGMMEQVLPRRWRRGATK